MHKRRDEIPPYAVKSIPASNRASQCTLEYGHSSGRATNPCFTGFNQQYRTCIQ